MGPVYSIYQFYSNSKDMTFPDAHSLNLIVQGPLQLMLEKKGINKSIMRGSCYPNPQMTFPQKP